MTEHSLRRAEGLRRCPGGVEPDRLEAALRAIRDYEWEVKSGQVDAELGLDVLLADSSGR